MDVRLHLQSRSSRFYGMLWPNSQHISRYNLYQKPCVVVNSYFWLSLAESLDAQADPATHSHLWRLAGT